MSPYNATLPRPWLFCLRVIVFLPPFSLSLLLPPSGACGHGFSELIHFLGHHLLCASLAGRLRKGWGCVVTCSARRLLPPGIIFHWTLHASTERVWRKGCLSSISTSLIWFSVLSISVHPRRIIYSAYSCKYSTTWEKVFMHRLDLVELKPLYACLVNNVSDCIKPPCWPLLCNVMTFNNK